jgi:hypothetical protein
MPMGFLKSEMPAYAASFLKAHQLFKKIPVISCGYHGIFKIKELTAVSAPCKGPVLGLYPTQSAASYNNTL